MEFILVLLVSLLEAALPPYPVVVEPKEEPTIIEFDAAVFRRMEQRRSGGLIISTPTISGAPYKR